MRKRTKNCDQNTPKGKAGKLKMMKTKFQLKLPLFFTLYNQQQEIRRSCCV